MDWMNSKIRRIKVKIQRYKAVNTLWQKLSNMSINTGLYLNTRFVWEKNTRITTSEISSILVQCSLKCGVLFFFASDDFQGTFVDFRFMMFTKVLMKELAGILIHFHKIFNWRVSFKMLLSMCLVTVEKKPQHSCDQLTFRIALPKNYHNMRRSLHIDILS